MSKFKIPAHEYQISFSRSSGAGGQNINKTNTKATLHWNALLTTSLPIEVQQRFLKKYANRLNSEGEIIIISQEHRTQHLNIAAVIKKLHEMIDSVTEPPKIRRATKPTKSSVKKRLSEKKIHSDKKKSRNEKF